MAITQRDIAKHVGVSLMTVSYAMRDDVRIAVETRRKVQQAALELGYRPNASARAIRDGRFGAIGVLMATHVSRSVLQFDTLWGIIEEMSRQDLHLTVGQIPDQKLIDDGFTPKLLREWSVDGLLINYTMNFPAHTVSLIRQFKLPSIWINNKLSSDCVYPDDLQAGREATKKLILAGHRKIAYVCFKDSGHYSEKDRTTGYVQAMQEAGLAPNLQTTNTRFDGIAKVQTLLSSADRPTAMTSYGLTELHDACALALSMSLRIPDDLSFLPIDGGNGRLGTLDFSAMVRPSYELGVEAVRLMVQKIAKPKEEVPPKALPFTYFQGDTVAPPAK